MRRHTLRRLGLTLLTAAVATMGLAAPAHAEPETGTISGRLTDNGAPVAGATVDAHGEGWNSAVTDADGRYRITDLPPGTDYRVFFMTPGRMNQYAYRATGWDSAAPFAVSAGAETVVDDSLFPVGTVTGRFTRPDGSPIEWALVSVATPDNGSLVETVTDADGHYTLQVPAGSHRLRFSGPSGAQYAPGKREFSQAGVYEVVAGQTLTVHETALAVGTITGRVTRADGSPVANRSVTVQSAADGSYAAGAGTDADGVYRADVFPGDYVVGLEAGAAYEYMPGGRARADAQVFTVAADAVVTVDETLRATGAVQGMFTDAAGNGVSSATVTLVNTVTGATLVTATHWQGFYNFPETPEGTYKVHFTAWDRPIDQWAYGKLNAADAATITVTAGQAVDVNDTQLSGGSIRVTAKNALTGAPITDFYAVTGRYDARAEQGVALLSDVPAGAWELNVHADGFVSAVAVPVTVVGGEQAAVELSLTPYARMTAKVVDAATGAPIEGVCVYPATTDRFRLAEGCPWASGADGVVTVDVEAGRYQFFALPLGSPYGAQWVGQDGGTGDQREAKSWTFTSGEVRDIHRIRMDKAGVVTGVVTGADGTPLTRGKVAVDTPVVGNGTVGDVGIGGDGRYTIGFLGPYAWPLNFQTDSHAWQWSGGEAKRHDAVKVTVQAGQTTTFDQQLKLGTEVRVTAAGSPDGGFAVAYTVGTGDVAGYRWVEQGGGEAVFRVLGSQHVTFQYNVGSGFRGGWYGGTDHASATPVRIYANGTPTVVSYQYS
ncbi:carboxypeptidase-like regulatory domain-containing protein [Catellatospora sichuanensis]|uniref:carboxypeptidase-like regulatory domain-containing protein n=1 Tax=Catellatospora sichuanensis TaxID=1969805 RepID=UPI001183A683|nr:carboxypeptidase-like regulatory domain-containing protein [Catellatospora sichuanensis]